MKMKEKVLQGEIQKGLVRESTYKEIQKDTVQRNNNKSQSTKFKSNQFVIECNEQSKFLQSKTENPISFSDVQNVGVLSKRLGARIKIIREVARRAEKDYS